MKIKRILALILVLALTATVLSGCFPSILLNFLAEGLDELESFTEEEITESTTEKPQSGNIIVVDGNTYYEDVDHGDVAFSDMDYEHYDTAAFDDMIAEVYDIAKNGTESESFEELDYAIIDEIYYANTLYSLIEIQYDKNPLDEDVAKECEYARETYMDMNDAYWSAMCTLANSQYKYLLEEQYHEVYVSWFESYNDGDSSELTKLYAKEAQLEKEYYSIVGNDDVDYDAILNIFIELVDIRNRIAANNGYDSYAEYAYYGTYSRDYGPEDSKKIWDAAKEYFVPIMDKYGYEVNNMTDELYYNCPIDCSEEMILEKTAEYLPRISGEANEAFEYMREYGLYDISESDTKVNTGYTLPLYYVNQPYLFNCPRGNYTDYQDFFHELGHYVNYYYVVPDLLFGVGSNDLSELQSQGMEIMFTEFYDGIFGEKYSEAIEADTVMAMVYSIIDGAMYDEFLYKVYAQENLTPEKVIDTYKAVYDEYGYIEYDDYLYDWMLIEHNVCYPFYYMSYGVSAISALEIYRMMEEESFDIAADKFLRISAMDSEAYYFSEALEEAGLTDIFDMDAAKEIAEAVADCMEDFVH